ncbi:MAG: hypothetical protein LUQ07_00775 [Methanospirillum sp.]|nr:hypothetical protein [Methanospirillum sp.]
MRHEASFCFYTKDATIIAASLIPESDETPDGRSWGTCRIISPEKLEIRIQADDITALRASLNSWLRLVQIAEEMVQTTGRSGER